jgi:hypothetical protein
MKVKFQIPAELNGIELHQYQFYNKILSANKGEENSAFVQIKILEHFTSTPAEQLRKMKVDSFEAAVNALAETLNQEAQFCKLITVNGREFGFIPKLDDMSIGEYVDLEKYLSDVSTFHKAMAVMYRPVTSKSGDTYLIEEYETSEKHCDVMLSAGLSDVLGAVVFFWNLGKELSEDILSCFLEEETLAKKDNVSVTAGAGTNHSYIYQMETLLSSIKSQNSIYTNVSLN